MSKIGLVTVLFNSDDVLEGFFKSLSEQNFIDYHLFLIDNTPSAQSDQLINSLLIKYPVSAYTHVRNEENYGVATGNNQGIKLSVEAGTSYTLLLNNDIEFSDSFFLENMVKLAQTKNEALIIPKILFYDSRKIWMAGGKFIFHKGITNHVGEGQDDGPLFNQEAYFDYAPTCFMLINNEVFEKVGLMDEKYFVYYDDTDFLYRCYTNGYQIKYLPQFVVLHKVSSLTVTGSNFSVYYANRNRIYFIRKNFRYLRYMIAMSFTVLSRGIIYLRSGKEMKALLFKAIKNGFEM